MTAGRAEAPRGVTAKILGVVMVIVAGLDMMLFWRSGQSPSWFFMSILAAGLMIYFIGVVRAGASNNSGKHELTQEQDR